MPRYYPKQKLIVLFCLLSLFLPISDALAESVLSSHKYAWSDNVGYINFEGVFVNDSALSGYAWSANKGFINFSPALGGVLNDSNGNLSGAAWGEQLGWIDFDNVSINEDGKFSGTAFGTLVGTITFDCPNYCDVETDWRKNSLPSISSSSSSSSSKTSSSALGKRLPDFDTLPLAANNAIGQTTISAPSKIPVAIKLLPDSSSTEADIEPNPTTDNSNEGSALFDVISEPVKARVAPGELLPVPVKLSNFGSNNRIDVLIEYSILSNTGEEIYTTQETVAVETTANFVKTIQIPFDTTPGIYTARTSITYKGQLVPATSQFSFTVERKIFGLFQSDFYLYGGITLFLIILALLLGGALIKQHRKVRSALLDYSDVPHDKRIFYEIISDTVTQMRQRVGDEAIVIASNIPGLKIDKRSGRVLAMTDQPSKIIAKLVSDYEKLLGKKVSFSLRREEE